MSAALARIRAPLVLLALVLGSGAAIGAAPAAAEAVWSGSEQPVPPGSSWPVGLGRIGDIEFQAPDRGLLITEGRPPTVPAGLWSYNGVEWHEYASVCGASQKETAPEDGGRIAWAGPSEFWTVSDGRPGQANESGSQGMEREPPLEDNTLCHFSGGQIVGSYAHPAFQSDSYQLMHGAACLAPSDCWFGGEALPPPQVGAFQLHWNGGSLEAEPTFGEPNPIADMRALEGNLYESTLLTTAPGAEPPAVYRSEGGLPFQPEEATIPLYAGAEPPAALGPLRLAAGEGLLWAAAGAHPLSGGGATPGQVTVLQRRRGLWSQVIGPGNAESGTEPRPLPALFPGEERKEEALLGGEARFADVRAIAAEPGTERVWVALAPPGAAAPTDRRAVLIHVGSEGELLEPPVVLPDEQEQQAGLGPKGPVAKLSCPGEEDCWMATSEGWLFHFAPPAARSVGRDPNEGEFFRGLISFRPVDQGLPQVTPDAPPADTSGEPPSEVEREEIIKEAPGGPHTSLVTLPLMSSLHSRVVHGNILQLRFHLSVKAKVRLIAKRRRAVVGRTAMRTFDEGNRMLTLRLNRRRWPTALKLQTKALAPLRVVPSVGGAGGNVGVISTGESVLPRSALQGGDPLR